MTGPAFDDNELISGVEDMQVQYGLSPKVDTDGDGIKDSYSGAAVTYSDTIPEDYQVVSVRVWLLMRAEQPEVGFVDGRKYEYADRPSYQPNDGYRRLLISRTIQLRKSRS
jgi:type IV pilus assembly protein PilW